MIWKLQPLKLNPIISHCELIIILYLLEVKIMKETLTSKRQIHTHNKDLTRSITYRLPEKLS